jgi:hypothetical protein
VLGGIDETGNYMVLGCAIMGRSKNSRNRVYRRDGGRVFTDLAHPDPAADTALTIYNAMDEHGMLFVASNGVQTDTAIKYLARGLSFTQAMAEHTFEPDEPNYTPRITALCSIEVLPALTLSRISKLEHAHPTVDPHHEFYEYFSTKGQLPAGHGYALQTYAGDGNPLPTMYGKPYSLPLRGAIDILADQLWSTLNEDNRVGLALKFIEIKTGFSNLTLRNKADGN